LAWDDMPKHWYEDYERGRPGYPSKSVDVVGVPPSATVLDLGAGTGKLTRLLIGRFAHVIAVEPDDQMRRLHGLNCPDVEVLEGNAEEIPIVDRAVDAVFAAQSFHTFANERAVAEIARVLRPGGALVLMWNVQAGTPEPSIEAVEHLLDRHWPKGWDPLDLGIGYGSAKFEWHAMFAQSAFGEINETRFPNPHTVDREGLVAFFDSMGWIAVLPDEERLQLLDEVRSLLTASVYAMPWETHVYWARFRPDA